MEWLVGVHGDPHMTKLMYSAVVNYGGKMWRHRVKYDEFGGEVQLISSIYGNSVILKFKDMRGQEEFSAMREQYFSNSQGFMLIYSCFDLSSFERMRHGRKQILRVKENSESEIPFILVGNTCDGESERLRIVTEVQGKDLAKEWKCPFFEAPIKPGCNLDNILTTIALEISTKYSGEIYFYCLVLLRAPPYFFCASKLSLQI